MINEIMTVTGDVEITVKDTMTGISYKRNIKNLVVTIGKSFIASRMSGTTQPVMTTMAVGTDNTAANVTDTALGAELASVNLTVAGGTPTTTTVLYTATFPPGTGTGALAEAGIFGDIMLARTTFAVINKGASDEMTVNWTITIG